jgi:hypothetical protein
LFYIVFHFLCSSILLTISCEIHHFQAFLSTFSIKSLRASTTHLIKIVENYLFRSNQSILNIFVKHYVNFSNHMQGDLAKLHLNFYHILTAAPRRFHDLYFPSLFK